MECSHDVDDIESAVPIPMNLFEDQALMESVVLNMINTDIKTQKEMDKFIREQQQRIHKTIAHNQLLYTYRCMIQANKISNKKQFEQFLISKSVRGTSGVMVITLMTSAYPKKVKSDFSDEYNNSDPFYKSEEAIRLAKEYSKFSCKFNCDYCPEEPNMPRSYIKREPAVARAVQNNFDPVLQFRDRGKAYLISGHPVDKIELIISGGTWSSYDSEYQEEFIRDSYYAANTFYQRDFDTTSRTRLSLEEEIKINRTSKCRIIALTLETRPDQINATELIRFRRFGVTRVQLGIQNTDNHILRYVSRGCTNEDAIASIKLLKDNGFKIDIHIMPDLPLSTPESDKRMFEYILNSPDLQADDWKIYPTSVVKWSRIETWYNNHKRNYDTETNPEKLSFKDNKIYKPYAEDIIENIKIKHGKTEIYSNPLIELIIWVKSQVHPWIRLNRVIRDLPHLYISTEGYREDLRQIIQKEMQKKGLKCKCIRCREVKNKQSDISQAKLIVRQYFASGGVEYFISFESSDESILYGFLRLRISKDSGSVFPELKDTAMIRELHVYGKVAKVDEKNMLDDKIQHKGLGKKLIQKAEEITLQNNLNRIAVIAGIGVITYYHKQGYLDYPGKGSYQIKILTKPSQFLFTQNIFSILVILLSIIIILFIFY